MKKIIIFLLTVFLLNSCGFFASKPAEKPVQQPPAWFMNPASAPQDPRFLYGTANSSNREKAVNLALQDIAASLSVSIQSSSTANRYKSGTTTNSSFQEQIKSEVAKIEFSGQKIENQELVNDKYYVRVSVPKANLTEKAATAFRNIDTRVKDAMASLGGMNKLNRFFLLRRTRPDVNEGYSKLLFLESMKSVDPFSALDSNSLSSDISRYEGYVSDTDKVSRETTFTVKSEPKFNSAAKTIAQELSAIGISSSVNGSGSDGIIMVEGNEQTGEVQGYKSVTQNLTVTVQDSTGKRLQTKNFNITGYSPVNHDLARENVGAKFKESLDKAGGLIKSLDI